MIKKIASYILIVFFSLAVSAYAQEWPSSGDILEKAQTDLNLTQEQFVRVKVIIEENMTKRQQVTPQLTQGLTQAQSLPLDSELYLKLSEVLTKPQMSQWNITLTHMLQEAHASRAGK